MRGPLKAALLLAPALATALAVRAPEIQEFDGSVDDSVTDHSSALVSVELPSDSGSPDIWATQVVGFRIDVLKSEEACGFGNVTINGQVLPQRLEGNVLTGKGSLSTDRKGVAVASWAFHCVKVNGQDDAQLLKFAVDFFEGKKMRDVGFSVAFKQTGATEIINIETDLSVPDQIVANPNPEDLQPVGDNGNSLPYNIDEDIAELQWMKAQLEELEFFIAEKEQTIADHMSDSFDEDIKDCDSLKCVVKAVADKARKAANSLYGKLSGDEEMSAEGHEKSRKPKPPHNGHHSKGNHTHPGYPGHGKGNHTHPGPPHRKPHHHRPLPICRYPPPPHHGPHHGPPPYHPHPHHGPPPHHPPPHHGPPPHHNSGSPDHGPGGPHEPHGGPERGPERRPEDHPKHEHEGHGPEDRPEHKHEGHGPEHRPEDRPEHEHNGHDRPGPPESHERPHHPPPHDGRPFSPPSHFEDQGHMEGDFGLPPPGPHHGPGGPHGMGRGLQVLKFSAIGFLFAFLMIALHRRFRPSSHKKSRKARREERHRRRANRRAAKQHAISRFLSRFSSDTDDEFDDYEEKREALLAEEEDRMPTTMAEELSQCRNAASVVEDLVVAEAGRAQAPVESAPAAVSETSLMMRNYDISSQVGDEQLPAYEDNDNDGSEASTFVADGFRYTPGSSNYSPSHSSAGSQ
ncbi:hypothetical protein LSUE1_G007628 [Lachnellula suecica]|uniref:Uncharacterized protein n=1 Tax=Lachnellula suecica TaxID=602035 RepID=A0A8T9C1Y2_9HELO|nr:hypothetical protein LSUE1_G007628 [Lachnellula suecica]